MTDVAARRLRTQRLTGERFASAVAAVGWLGAVQSQDYAGAKWALGQRTAGATDADLDRLFNQGSLLRTHIMRPTWHFVLPADIRWLQDLTSHRVRALLAPYGRQWEVDGALLNRSCTAVMTALRDGTHLSRRELGTALERSGIRLANLQLGYVLMHAELDALICSGPRKGKQMTYALLAERAPNARRLDRDEALAELTRRYFTGHGPAQPQDFAWWSGRTVADARRGLDLVGADLINELIGSKSHWSAPGPSPTMGPDPIVHLLPNYDEFLIAYRDRSAAAELAQGRGLAPLPEASFLAHLLILNGQVWGGWKRRNEPRRVVVDLGWVHPLDADERAALERAAGELATFIDLPVTVERLN